MEHDQDNAKRLTSRNYLLIRRIVHKNSIKEVWCMLKQDIHDLVMLTLKKCKLKNDGGNEIDLAREIFQKYVEIEAAMLAEFNNNKYR